MNLIKNKKANYVLLPAVVMIWALVTYKIADNSSSQPHSTKLGSTESVVLAQNESEVRFELIANYPDPFLSSRGSSPRNTAPKPVKASKSRISELKKPDKMPKLQFIGLVSNSNSGSSAGIFILDQKELLLKTGEEEENLKILSLHKNKATVKLYGKKVELNLEE